MENTKLNYLTKVLGVRYIPKVESYEVKTCQYDKLTLVAYLDLEDAIQVRDFEKLKKLLSDYGVLGLVFTNKDNINTGGLILSLGRSVSLSCDLENGIWNRIGDQMIMITHPVSKFSDRGIKAIVWRDIKRAIRMCGVEV